MSTSYTILKTYLIASVHELFEFCRSRKKCTLMQEYSQRFAREYPPELWQEPGLTESTEDGTGLQFENIGKSFQVISLKNH